MKKKSLFMLILASMALVTSCSSDDEGAKTSQEKGSPISFYTSVGSRAVETTTANLTEFQTYSFQEGQANYMDGISYKLSGGAWSTEAGTFYWPVTGDLHFYCYAPAAPGSEGVFTMNSTEQKVTGFVPYTTAATQQDFIFAQATGNLKGNGTSGIDLNFEHALSEITVQAKNANTAYTVEVTGVKLGNITSKGDFTFPTVAGGDAAWSLGQDKSEYTTEWTTANKLTENASALDESNVAFMLLPQQLEAETKAIEGSYLALKVKITMQGGKVVRDGWAYIALATKWEMGKRYNYTVDFTSGAGQDEDGNDIISGTSVKYNVTVTPWTPSKQDVNA